jgi:uncharacterized protein
MLRLSNYTIFVDLPDSGGDVLLVQGYSGAWDLVTVEIARRLRQLRGSERFKPIAGNFDDGDDIDAPHSESSMPEDVVNLLVRRGYLTELTPEEEQQRVANIAIQLHGMAQNESPSYVFALTYDCNLRCDYCFQDALRADSANTPKLGVMSTEMVDRIFSAMPQVEARHARRHGTAAAPSIPRITLFGGEPLLGRHRPVVSHILKRARELGPPSIAAITNGTELQYFTDLIGPDGISFLQITLDGSRSEHDRRRIGPLGLPTFDIIADNIDLALEHGAKVKIRVNVDSSNVCSLPELADTITARGWADRDGLSVYTTPVHESPGSEHEACGFGSWGLSQQLAELAAVQRNMRVFESPDSPLKRRLRTVLRGERDPLLGFQPSFCGAHTRVWVFDALGDIYACWERAGDGVSRIGRLSDEGKLVMNPPSLKVWRERTIASNPVCNRCPYAFYCGGGCALLAEMKNGSIHSSFCDDFAKRFKSIAIEELAAAQFNQFVQTFDPSSI